MTGRTGALDLGRLAQLEQLLGSDLAQIVRTLVEELQQAITAIEAALGNGDLPAVADAAHAARNSALMVDARPLLAVLDALETGARHADGPGLRLAERRLKRTWPPLRAELERAGSKIP